MAHGWRAVCWVLLQVPETRSQEINWAKVGKWCSTKSQAPSSTAPGLSLGEKGASFSRKLHRLYHGQEVRGSIYCCLPTAALSHRAQLLSVLPGDVNTEEVLGVWCELACNWIRRLLCGGILAINSPSTRSSQPEQK